MPEPPTVSTLHRTREHPDGAVLLETALDAVVLTPDQAEELGLQLYIAARELRGRFPEPQATEDSHAPRIRHDRPAQRTR